jgi:hypothetical protein
MSIENKGKVPKRNKAFNLKSKPTNELYSWYDSIPDHMKPKVANPAYDHHKVSMPCRVILVGASGAGKTCLFVDFLYRCPETFNRIILCSPMANEPLYAYLKSKLKEGDMVVCGSVRELPVLEDIEQDKDEHTLVVFDDVVVERNQKPIEDYFIRCRKKPASVFYISQSYFAVPKIIRQQASHIWLRKMSGVRDIKLVMSDFSIDLKPNEMWKMYSDCVEKGSFLNIAITDPEAERFRCGYLEVINPKEYKGIMDDEDKYDGHHNEDEEDSKDTKDTTTHTTIIGGKTGDGRVETIAERIRRLRA